MSPCPEELRPPIDSEIREATEIIKKVVKDLTKQNQLPKPVGIVVDVGQKGLCVHPLVEIDTTMADSGHLYKTVVLGGDGFSDSYSTDRQRNEPLNGITIDFGEWVGKLDYSVDPSFRINLKELAQGSRKAVIFSNTIVSLERSLTDAIKKTEYPLLVEGLRRAAGVI